MLSNTQRTYSIPVYPNSRSLRHSQRASSSPSVVLTRLTPTADVVNGIWTTLLERLRQSRVPTNPALIIRQHRFLDPASASGNVGTWITLMEEPLKVTDTDVNTILPLRAASLTDVPSNDGSYGFYLRSFPLEVRQLQRVLDSWEEAGLFFEEVGAWTSAITFGRLRDSDVIFIRYVGQYGPTSTALSRFEGDLKKRTAGVLAAFLRAIAVLMPEVLDSAKVYTFETATLRPLSSGHEVSQLLIDERERLLIALFGFRTLLNRQTGGFFAAHEFAAEDAELFAGLSTRVLSDGMLDLKSSPSDLNEALSDLMDDIFAFMVEHPILTGTARIPPSDRLKASMLSQATPSQINGNVLLAVLGKDITLEDFLEPRRYLMEEGSRAGHLLFHLIKTLQQWELGFGESFSNAGLNVTALFPFYDLIPWPRHDSCQALLDFLGRYLRIVKPLVVLSCSHLTSSVLAADLAHTQGLPSRNFLESVGIPKLCSFMDPDIFAEQGPEIEERDPQTYTIAIPALDPGRDKYGSQPESLRRVMLLTLMVGIAVVDLIRTTTVTAISRADAMNRALAVWETAEPYRRLAKALEDAKTQLQEAWSSINFRVGRTELSPEEHALRSFKAQTRAKTFVAEGAANSSERQVQTLRMWRLNWPDLHIRFGRNEKDAWFTWANGLEEGKSYFASAVALSGEGDKLYRLCQQFAPGEDFRDLGVRKRVIEMATERLRAGWSADKFSSERQAERGRKRLGWRKSGPAVVELHQVPVSIWADRRFRVTIETSAGDIFDIELRAPPSAVPENVEDNRYLTATEAGLNLCDQGGTVFKFKAEDLATWSKSYIAQHNYSAALIEAWSRTTSLPFEPPVVPQETVALILPKSFYGDIDSRATVSRSVRHLRDAAPEPNEPDWIVWLFLLEQFGFGPGRLFLCQLYQEPHWIPKIGSGVIMLRSTLLEFVSRPDYQHYPWRTQWIAILESNGTAHSAKKIKSALGALRTYRQDDRNDKVGSMSLNGKLLHIDNAPEWSVAEAVVAEEEELEAGDDSDDQL